jgi:hypothetical protein
MADFAESDSTLRGSVGIVQEVHRYVEEILALKTGMAKTSIASPWICKDILTQSIKRMKLEAKQANDTCTKIGLIGMSGLKGEAKESILDELRVNVRGSVSVLMSIVAGGDFSGPLIDYLCTALRAELHLIEELLITIEKGQNISLNSSVGMVWKAHESVQKLPETNKAAYRRSALQVLSIIDETSREFQEYLDTSKENAAEEAATGGGKEAEAAAIAEDEDMDDFDLDDFDMDSMGKYSPEEFPIVEAALALITRQKSMLKFGLNCVSEISDNVSKLSDHEAVKAACFQWIAESITLIKAAETRVVDLGAELYAPIDEEAVQHLSEENLSFLIAFGQKIIHPGFDLSSLSGGLSEQFIKNVENVQSLIDA